MDPVVVDAPRAAPTPVVASVPHAGTYVPPEILAALNGSFRHLPDTDWHVDRLYDFLPDLGVVVVRGTHNRYVADPNRAPTEPRFGPFADCVVAARSFAGEPLYDTPPTPDEVDTRVERVHGAYHRTLEALLDDRLERFGRAYLVDLHSFDTVIPNDVDLGDDDGATNSAELMPALHDALGGRFDVVRNEAWAGGYITRRHGRREGVEAVQVELNHARYLHEAELGGVTPPAWDHRRFRDAKERLREAFGEVVARLSPGGRSASGAGRPGAGGGSC